MVYKPWAVLETKSPSVLKRMLFERDAGSTFSGTVFLFLVLVVDDMENRDIEYFDRLWFDSQPKDGMVHNRETWDRMAEGWKKDPPEVQAAKNQQCIDMMQFFLERGVITEDSNVIDIGCGSGNYASLFAKTANWVTCSDVSPKMLELCKETMDEQGIENVDYIDCDFLTLDVDKSDWVKKYDLVFTSLTPAMDGVKSIEKVNKVSRRWCFNNSFVYRKDNLRNAVMENIFDKPVTNRWGNSSTYCLFNILWQMGLTPEIRYYKEVINHEYDLTMETAKGVAINVIRDREPNEEEIKRTFDYLQNMAVDGKITKTTESLFSWILWNVGD